MTSPLLQRSIFHAMRSQIIPKFFLHHRFIIGPVADGHFGDEVAFEDNQIRADAVEEPEISFTPTFDLAV